MKKYIALAIVAGLFSIGCANTDANIKRETARNIGGGLRPEDVNVSNVKRGMTEVKWDANTSKGNYNCSADDMMRRVYCTEAK